MSPFEWFFRKVELARQTGSRVTWTVCYDSDRGGPIESEEQTIFDFTGKGTN
jgi:hypothetical protein